jgi:hypothetical protein
MAKDKSKPRTISGAGSSTGAAAATGAGAAKASSAGSATGNAAVTGVGASEAAGTGTSYTVRPEAVENAYLKIKGAKGRATREQRTIAWQRHVVERHNALRDEHPNYTPKKFARAILKEPWPAGMKKPGERPIVDLIKSRP